ncbi:MAG: hypothetical protein ACLS4Z_02170 [Christensenellaceae bacterium]
MSVLCFIVFIVLACCKVGFGGLLAWLFPTITLAASVALVCHGLSNIYLSMIYREVQNRPKYIVAEKSIFNIHRRCAVRKRSFAFGALKNRFSKRKQYTSYAEY